MVRFRHWAPSVSLLIFFAAFADSATSTRAQAPAASSMSMVTEDRVEASDWWPTKGTAQFADFVGTEVCAKCHSQIAETQAATPMAHASSLPAHSDILQKHELLSRQLGPYEYELSSIGARSVYSVRDAGGSLSEPLVWAFGLGRKGQTYIYVKDGAYFESHLSFYKNLQALDITTGHRPDMPADLNSALGRRLETEEAQHCFGCHTSTSSVANHFAPATAAPGVTCESCHGPGAKHVAAMKAGRIEEGRAATLNPRHFSPAASIDFCGACHRTWADVVEQSTSGVINVRFQPYRLESSRCWQKSVSVTKRAGDARLTCIVCHDPHRQVDRETAAFDGKCLACHSRDGSDKGESNRRVTTCSVAQENCASCHMPQVEIPTMHATFTDHRIRVVVAGEPYPN